MKRYESREARFSARVLLSYAAAQLPETLALAAAGGQTEILLYDEIGFWGVTAKDFVQALEQAGPGEITVRINSPGGDVFDGLAIYNALRGRTSPVHVVVDGLAASAASFIAMAGTDLTMAEQSMMMIHNAWGIVIGDRNDMLNTAQVMEKIDGQLASIYAGKSGKPVAEIGDMMDAETWFTSTEAKDAGFCNAVSGGEDAREAIVARARLAVRIGAPPAATVLAPEWSCAADADLPVDTATDWDGSAASERMLDAAGFNGDSPDSERARRGFLAYDHANPKLKGSYKLPFADLVGGELRAVQGGLDAAASRMPDADIPDNVRAAARGVLDEYEKRSAPSDSDKAALAARRRRLRVTEAEAA